MEVISVSKAALLGLVQGLTEFLPVSSSGHLVLAQNLLGFTETHLFFDVIVHLGTFAAVTVFVWPEIISLFKVLFRVNWLSPKDLGRAWRGDENFRLLVMVGLATAVTGVIGLALKDFFERLYALPWAVGLALIVTGALLMATKNIDRDRTGPGAWTPGQAILIGLAQAGAIIPGISRSGSTICTGLFLGLTPETAIRFSFLLSLPAILGAVVLEGSGLSGSGADWPALAVGFAAAAVSGYAALFALLRLVIKGRLYIFAPYCWLVGAIALISDLVW